MMLDVSADKVGIGTKMDGRNLKITSGDVF